MVARHPRHSAYGVYPLSSARGVAYTVIRRVFEQGAYADRIISAESDRARLSDRDRALAMHLALGTVQRRRTLDEALAQVADRPANRLERRLLHALRLGCFQLLFADGVPEHAAVSETVELVRSVIGQRAVGIANAVLRRVATDGRPWFDALPDQTAVDAGVKHSLPDWIAELWFGAYGAERGRALCTAVNRTPEVALRENLLRAAPGEVAAALRAANVAFQTDSETGSFVLSDPFDLGGSDLFRSGKIFAQSRASTKVAQRVCADAGMRVLDLCAAPGGKTAVLAAAGAQVTAVERHAGRAKALRVTLLRLGIEADVVNADGRRFEAAAFDRILVDAPCSGLGVLAGRPDARWRRNFDSVAEIVQIQSELVKHASTLLAPGGKLVYCVCTLNPSENEQLVAGAGFTPDNELRTWPDENDDGFYCATLS